MAPHSHTVRPDLPLRSIRAFTHKLTPHPQPARLPLSLFAPFSFLLEKGRLRAQLDVTRAGTLGGSGTIAQLVFASLGFAFAGFFFASVVFVVVGQLSVGKFLESGLWILALIAPPCFTRAWSLRELWKAKDSGEGTSRLMSLERTIWLSTASFALFVATWGTFLGWFCIYYGATGGDLDLWPLFPHKPTHTYATFIGVTMPLFTVLYFILAWFSYRGNMKRAHTMIIIM